MMKSVPFKPPSLTGPRANCCMDPLRKLSTTQHALLGVDVNYSTPRRTAQSVFTPMPCSRRRPRALLAPALRGCTHPCAVLQPAPGSTHERADDRANPVVSLPQGQLRVSSCTTPRPAPRPPRWRLQHRWIENRASVIRDHTAYHGYFTLPEAGPEYHGGG